MHTELQLFHPFHLFSFLHLKKIKIAKIYVEYQKFQKRGACRSPIGRQAPCCPLHERPGPVAQPRGDKDLFAKKYLHLGPSV